MEMLSVEVAALQDKVASLEEECQDRCRMANEWYEALKVSIHMCTSLFIQNLGRPHGQNDLKLLPLMNFM